MYEETNSVLALNISCKRCDTTLVKKVICYILWFLLWRHYAPERSNVVTFPYGLHGSSNIKTQIQCNMYVKQHKTLNNLCNKSRNQYYWWNFTCTSFNRWSYSFNFRKPKYSLRSRTIYFTLSCKFQKKQLYDT